MLVLAVTKGFRPFQPFPANNALCPTGQRLTPSGPARCHSDFALAGSTASVTPSGSASTTDSGLPRSTWSSARSTAPAKSCASTAPARPCQSSTGTRVKFARPRSSSPYWAPPAIHSRKPHHGYAWAGIHQDAFLRKSSTSRQGYAPCQ